MSVRARILQAYRRVRAATEALVAPLSAEDQGLQSMPSCSPAKWHRAHTTWFFETFVLSPRGVRPHRESWGPLFNSYYVAVGPRSPRPKRGMLSRPSAAEVDDYRKAVDGEVARAIETEPEASLGALGELLALGLAHEQQHQELLLTDLLNAFADNPLAPVYAAPNRLARHAEAPSLAFARFEGGLVEQGAAPSAGFRFDNEEPLHRVYLAPFEIAMRAVTVREWKAFADAGGYTAPGLWLSEGYDWATQNEVRAPLYARREGSELLAYGLGGLRICADDEPISHVSYYEADAIARFLGARLPTEAEWEHAAAGLDPSVGNFADDGALGPLPFSVAPEARASTGASGLSQMFGDVWEWTSSAYGPYPGFAPDPSALGEYNGKFMVNQQVLRGGSCFTPRGHVRASYRNFWHPDTRFQMTGLRLARTVQS